MPKDFKDFSHNDIVFRELWFIQVTVKVKHKLVADFNDFSHIAALMTWSHNNFNDIAT